MRSMGQVRLVSVCILSDASNSQLASSADVVLPVCQPAYVYSREDDVKKTTKYMYKYYVHSRVCIRRLCYSDWTSERVVAYNQQREETKTKKKKGNMFEHIAHKPR